MNVKDWILLIVIVLLLGFVAFLWSNRFTARESLTGVRDKLSVALRGNDNLKEELLRAAEDNQKLIVLERESFDNSRRLADELRHANEYIYQLESQIRISDESLGRLDGLIERGNAIVEEGRRLLEEGTN